MFRICRSFPEGFPQCCYLITHRITPTLTLINALSSRTFRNAVGDSAWWGRLVENAVGSHLCNGLSGTEYSLTYWREGDKEVDFVVTRGDESWAVEVKSGRTGKLSGIEHFRRKYGDAKAIIVGTGGIPLEQFFMSEADVWFGIR